MTDESDAGRILREREQRRAVERARIDAERHDRELELSRLRLLDGATSDRTLEEVDREPLIRPAVSSAEHRRPGNAPIAENFVSPVAPSPRAIGGPLRPPTLAEFLQTNPMERFDIQALNALHLPTIIEGAQGDPVLLSAIRRQAEALMGRVKLELDDPISAGAFLRDFVLRWYRESPDDPVWANRMPERWGGLFAESRVSGGRLAPWLNLRLWSLREQTSSAGSIRRALKRSLSRDRRIEASVGRTVSQQIRAEVAQAILDDLAAHPRAPDAPTPLVRLSELAVRRQVPTINDALALLFNAPESGPFVLLHPNRYPDCDEVQIHPPAGNAMGAALAYTLVSGRPGRKALGRGKGSRQESAEAIGEDSGAPPGDEEVDATTIWQAPDVEPASWRRVIKEQRRERRRLDPPPKDYRGSAAYSALRDLLLEDGDFRQAFLSVKWRGRPSGLPLLAQMLQKGTVAPEVATDHEYLEAELGDLAQGDPQWHPADGRWITHGWTILREGSHHEGFRFSAKRSG